ncbi:MAG: hypothetical protein Q9168_006099, partial [Polycauliona sp. 1 TL-2023]
MKNYHLIIAEHLNYRQKDFNEGNPNWFNEFSFGQSEVVPYAQVSGWMKRFFKNLASQNESLALPDLTVPNENVVGPVAIEPASDAVNDDVKMVQEGPAPPSSDLNAGSTADFTYLYFILISLSAIHPK